MKIVLVTIPVLLTVAPGGGGPGYSRHKSSGSRSSEASSAYSGGSDTMQVRYFALITYKPFDKLAFKR